MGILVARIPVAKCLSSDFIRFRTNAFISPRRFPQLHLRRLPFMDGERGCAKCAVEFAQRRITDLRSRRTGESLHRRLQVCSKSLAKHRQRTSEDDLFGIESANEMAQ